MHAQFELKINYFLHPISHIYIYISIVAVDREALLAAYEISVFSEIYFANAAHKHFSN